MSEHAVRIIEVGEVRPHANADRLCIVPVGGWSCVVSKEQFKPGDRAIYIEPDYVVPLDRSEHPETVLYGETYGPVQSLRYGLQEPAFAAFAALRHGEWQSLPKLHKSWIEFEVPFCAEVYIGPYDREAIANMAEEDSMHACVAGHMMEGVVIVPTVERRDDRIGRVALKLISNRYWLS